MSKLCTIRIGSTTRAGRVEGDDIVILEAADVGEVLRTGDHTETGDAIPRSSADLAPIVTAPDIIELETSLMLRTSFTIFRP